MTISIPKSVTGMKASVVDRYDFSDIAWFNNSTDPNHLKWLRMAEDFIQVKDAFYIRDRFTGRWTGLADKATAIRCYYQQYGGTVSLVGHTMIITMDDVKAFAAAGIVTVSGTIYAPGMPDFLVFRGEKRLNTYTDERLYGDTDHIPAAEELLKIIRGSLCNEDGDLDLMTMWEEIDGKEPTPFKWVMHWLAARYQIPGFCPMTNLWFIGKQRGTGKGTLVDAMRGVLGATAVGKANQQDISGKWTDSLSGHLLIEWDEFKSPGGWREFNNLLKEMTGNKVIMTNKRHVGGSVHPNVGMHIFTTNEERPIMVEANDRQNTFISTTKDVIWRKRSTALWNPVTSEYADAQMLSGFAALLNEIKVDLGFISVPLKTEKFKELAAGSAESVEQWIDDGGAEHLRDTFVPWDDLHIQYKSYVRDHLHSKHDDIREFKRKMIDLGYAKDAPRKVPGPMGDWKSVRCAIIELPASVFQHVLEREESRSNTPIVQFPRRKG